MVKREGKLFKVRKVMPIEMGEVAAFCSPGPSDDNVRKLRRERRNWLTASSPGGLTVYVALDEKPPSWFKPGKGGVLPAELPALHDGVIAGLIEFAPVEATLYPVTGEGFLFIDCLRVAPLYENCGVGRALLRAVIGEARRRRLGVAVIAWENERVNDFYFMPAGFFRNAGFEVLEKDGRRVLMAIDYRPNATIKLIKVVPGEAGGWEVLYHPSCPASVAAAAEICEEAQRNSVPGVKTSSVGGREDVARRGLFLGLIREGKVIVNRLAVLRDFLSALKGT